MYSKIFNFYSQSKSYYFETRPQWLFQDVDNRLGIFQHEKLYHHKNAITYSIDNKNQPINIFVIGEGNYGKSTLINSIIKDDVAETNFLPNTWSIHKYCFGKDETHLYYDDGRILKLDHNSARVLLKKEEINYTNNNAYIPPIYRVDWHFSKYPILNHFVIVDTPGLAQIRNLKSQQTIEDFYYQADCVIWLFDAQRVNSESSLKYVEKMSRFTKKTIGVINKWDIITSPEAKKRILDLVNKHFAKYLSDIQPISAKLAWQGKDDLDKFTNSMLPLLLQKIRMLFLKNQRLNKIIGFYFQSNTVLGESRMILSNEELTHQSNLDIYSKNKQRISINKGDASKSVCEYFRNSADQIFSGLHSRIRANVTPINAKNMVGSLIDNRQINSSIQSSVTQAMKLRDSLYYKLIQDLSQEQYKDVKYDKDGSVLSKQDMPSLGRLAPPSYIPSINISVDINVSGFDKFIYGATEFLQIIPFFGSGFKEANDNQRRKLQDSIINQIRSRTNSYVPNIESSIKANISTCYTNLLESFESQFRTHFISISNLEEIKKKTAGLNDLALLPQKRFVRNLLGILNKGNKYANKK